MKAVISLMLLCIILTSAYSQPESTNSVVSSVEHNGFSFAHFNELTIPKKTFHAEDCMHYQEDLLEAYQRNKDFLDQALLPSLIALAYYPELKDTKIRFVYLDTKTTLAARPRFWSLFRGRDKRSYNIFIDKDVKQREGVLFEDFPFNAQLGGIGHEYAHIIDYSKRSGLDILWLGIKYLFSKRAKAKLEHKVDKIAIERGLGWQAIAWEEHVLQNSEASKKYKTYKKSVYLSAEEIKEHMQNCSVYEAGR